MLKPRKVPLRKCVGCHEMKPKRELIRVVKSPEGAISLDRVGKAPGRGAYVCPSADCLKKAMKSKGLERALKASIDPLVYEQLGQQLESVSP